MSNYANRKGILLNVGLPNKSIHVRVGTNHLKVEKKVEVRQFTHIETRLRTEKGPFEVYLDSGALYKIIKRRKFKIGLKLWNECRLQVVQIRPGDFQLTVG